MITKADLDEAIAEMNGQRHPNADTCIKLAAFYTIRNELFPGESTAQIDRSYSYDAPSVQPDSTIDYQSGTEFGEAVTGKTISDVLKRLDEVMTGLYVVEPSLYRKILRDMTN